MPAAPLGPRRGLPRIAGGPSRRVVAADTASARWVWRAGCALLAAQAIGLIAVSVHMWRRFDLTSDFATFHQAWQQIATGHLDPYLSTFAFNYPSYGYPFWQSHFELIMWPLALLWHVWPSSLALLVVQDLALAGAGAVALRWGLDLGTTAAPAGIRPRRRGWDRGAVIGAGLLVVILVDPWTYWTAWYDFHLQPLAVLFTLLAGRSLWRGQRRGWVWVLATLLCGDVAATYVLALGVSALALSRTRRQGVALVACGLAWLAVVSVAGSGRGSTLADRYGYLTNGGVGSGLVGITTIVAGIGRHPHPAVHVVATRWKEIYKYVAATGTVGALTPLGLPMAVVVLGANALNQSPVFIGATAAFQSEMAVMAGAVGAAGVLAWASRRRWGPAGAAAVAAIGVAMVAQAVVTSVHWAPKVRSLLQVPASTAAQLAAVERRIPPDAEVIVSQGVIGRFGGHRWVYPFLDSFGDGQTVPIHPGQVAFVFCDAGIEAASPAQTADAVGVARGLGASLLASGRGVTALVWTPPPATRTVHFRS